MKIWHKKTHLGKFANSLRFFTADFHSFNPNLHPEAHHWVALQPCCNLWAEGDMNEQDDGITSWNRAVVCPECTGDGLL